MGGWTKHQGRAMILPLDNIDTDQLIPARFMSVPRAEGYGKYQLHDVRRDPDGKLLADFPLNGAAKASIMIAGRNFGSGSSREAAVYALVDAGFRVIIAESFGDIFVGNSVNNGLLPATVNSDDLAVLTDAVEHGAEISVELDSGKFCAGDAEVEFVLDDSQRTKLMNGWDDIDLTLRHASEIEAFGDRRNQTAKWAWPVAAD